MTKRGTPFQWYGGKFKAASRICSLMPSHKQYIEPFFGAGNVFFAKEPCPHETVNDIDHGVMNFFRVLRDHTDELLRLVELTPQSRELLEECEAQWRCEEDPVRKAWMWWVVANQSFAGAFGASWASSVTATASGMTVLCSKLANAPHSLLAMAIRLKRTQIECAPAMRVLERYCTPDSLAYSDPPYLLETRSAPIGVYANEMNVFDHEALVDALLSLPGRFMVSCYRHPIYDRLAEHGWKCVEWTHYATSVSKARPTAPTGVPQDGTFRRTELLWLDPKTASEKLDSARLSLLSEEEEDEQAAPSRAHQETAHEAQWPQKRN